MEPGRPVGHALRFCAGVALAEGPVAMKSEPQRINLVDDPAQHDVRVRCLTLIDDFHAKLDRMFDDLLLISRLRGLGPVGQSTVVRETEPPDRMVR
jgi:hypothetical protein